MYKKIILTFITILGLTLINHTPVGAWSDHYQDDPYNIISNVYYNQNSDRIEIVLTETATNRSVKKIERTVFGNHWSDVVDQKTNTSSGYYSKIYINCPGRFQFKLYNNQNDYLATISIRAYDEDFQKPNGSCEGSIGEDDGQQSEEWNYDVISDTTNAFGNATMYDSGLSIRFNQNKINEIRLKHCVGGSCDDYTISHEYYDAYYRDIQLERDGEWHITGLNANGQTVLNMKFNLPPGSVVDPAPIWESEPYNTYLIVNEFDPPEDEPEIPPEWENDPVLYGYAACIQKAQNTGQSWQYLQNPNTMEWQCVLTTDCLYGSTDWFCSATEFDPDEYQQEPGDGGSNDPYDKNGNGINDYLELDFDDPMVYQPYCDQLIPGKDPTKIGSRFGDHPSIPCIESDPNWYDLPICDPNFIDWEDCREGDTPPWELPYPDFLNWGNGDNEPEPPEECGICKVFECPGWDEYLGFLSDIVDNAIGDIEVPEIPDFGSAPKPPNIFDILNEVDERNDVQKPTGQEDPELENASFNAEDIKNSAPEIQFREDPTGGFDIVNPLDTLPEDGSTAPRPQEELETLPYPGGSGNESNTPTPTPSDDYSDNVTIPQSPNDTVTPPTTGGNVKTPSFGDTATYPTID